jgi:hypothetical protein
MWIDLLFVPSFGLIKLGNYIFGRLQQKGCYIILLPVQTFYSRAQQELIRWLSPIIRNQD